MVGFEAVGIITENIASPVQQVYRDLIVLQRDQPTLWDAFVNAYVRTAVEVRSAVIFTFMDHNTVYTRILMHDTPRATAWGIPGRCVARCADSYDVHVEKKRSHGLWYKISCRTCDRHWYVGKPSWVHEIPNHSNWFWADYPLREPQWPTLADVLPPQAQPSVKGVGSKKRKLRHA